MEFLSFTLAEATYGLPLGAVREIVGLPPITRVPNAPSTLRGVISLRGAVVPVVDLRAQLGLPEVAYTKYTVAIIAEVQGCAVGLVVDGVLDVILLKEGDILPPPTNLAPRLRLDFVTGLARSGEGGLLLLEMERMLTDDVLGVLRKGVAS